MIGWLQATIHWALAHRSLVLSGWLLILLGGVLSALRLPVDAFPDTTPVQVQVNTMAPALGPLEVERQVTITVEQALLGLPELVELRSLSKPGFSQLTLVFDEGTDLWRARQMITERLANVRLPQGLEPPSLGPVASGLGEVFHYLVRGKTRSLAELRAIQDWMIAPQLRSVPGVAEVNTWGGDERRVEVHVDPARLSAQGLSLHEVIVALQENNLNVGGGTISRGGEGTVVQGVGILTTLQEVEAVVLSSTAGTPLRVGDIAQVVEGRELRHGAVTADGTGEVVLGLGFLLMGENSHDVTSRLAVRLEEIKKSVPTDVQVEAVYQRTTLVDQVLGTVETNLFEGALLVIAVVFVFLGNWRAGLIVALIIPTSLLFATNLMLGLGVAGSLMSLGAIDFGLLVDSTIIQVENTVRRLSEGGGQARLEVVEAAAVEVLGPTMYGQLVILVVYLPLLTLEGIEGRLFRPMALTVSFALVGSTLASLTLVPVLSSFLLGRGRRDDENRLIRGLKSLYQRVLGAALAAPALVLSLALLSLLNAAFLLTRLGSEFVPRLGEGAVVINTIRLASVSLDESTRYGTQIERLILEKFPDEVERVWTRTGTAEVATDPMGAELSDVFVTMTPPTQWRRATSQTELVEQLSAQLAVMPGMRMVFTQPIEMRVNEMIAGIRADVGIKLFGDDLDVLRAKAREIETVAKAVPGAADVVTEVMTGLPTLSVEVDRAASGRHSVPASEILSLVEALAGKDVGEVQDGERRFPLVVQLAPRELAAETIGSLLVTTPAGLAMPLGSVARLVTQEGPSTIQREWGRRRVVVQTNVRGRDVGSFVAELARQIAAQVELPAGYYVRFGGQFEHLERARSRLLLVVPLALALIFSLLYATYGRVLDAVRVFTGVPFAVVGGVVALWLRGLPLSVPAAVGFVALSGVSVLADMVLVSTIRRTLDAGVELREAVIGAAQERLRPVLMTALVASLGFLPMAFNTGVGAEVQRPLATVVIGGLMSSTALTLVVLPVLYTVLRRGR